jgi:Gram positive anchor.
MKHKKILVMSATALISTSFLATQVVSADNKVIDKVNISTVDTTTIKQKLIAIIKEGKTYINYSKYDKLAIDTLVQYISFAESDIKNGASDALMQTDIDSINSSILLVKNSETNSTDTTSTTDNTDTTSTKVNADTTSATNKSTTLVKNKISDSKELKSSKSTLPQTGEDDAWGLALLGLITLSVASWFTFRKKKSNIN